MAGLGLQDPKHLAIKAVVESKAGIQAAKEAAAKGEPAICGLDKLLRGIIVNYTDDDQSIKSAGSLIAEILRAAGYTKGAIRPCSPDCMARSGTLWTPPGTGPG